MNNETEKIVDKKLNEFKKKNMSFRSWRKFDSIVDSHSPITPASQRASFFGTLPITKPTVTGAKGGNAALTSLIAQLVALGLIIDSTT